MAMEGDTYQNTVTVSMETLKAIANALAASEDTQMRGFADVCQKYTLSSQCANINVLVSDAVQLCRRVCIPL
jgi:hypothetical protein